VVKKPGFFGKLFASLRVTAIILFEICDEASVLQGRYFTAVVYFKLLI